MIVSHKHKFIFIHVTKCAGTSITYALAPYLGENDLVLGCTSEGEKLNEEGIRSGGLQKHSTALAVRKVLGERVWDSYYKFAFVRNPWDLLVSTYYWWQTTQWDDDKGTGKKIRELGDFEDYLLSPYRRKLSCLEFISDSDGMVLVDFVGKQEDIRVDFPHVCREIGLPIMELPLKNSSSHQEYSAYYNPLTRDLVGQWFQRDISRFDYTFNSNMKGPCFETSNARRKSSHLIVHCCHHRVGTVWFGRILRNLAKELGWKFQVCEQDDLEPDTDIFMQSRSKVDLRCLPDYNGSHIIRDPRDIIVSAYFYHLWCDEIRYNVKRPDYGDRSHQEVLNSLPRDKGISIEIMGCHNAIAIMADWDYLNPNFIEIRFEDVIQDQQGVFREIFLQYGLTERQIKLGLSIVDRFTFEKITGRNRGQENNKHHFRKGVPGDWKNHFTVEHRQLFKQQYPGLLQKLGYEKNDNW